MQYFTNSQLKAQYAVSYDTVRNWIERAKTGKVELQLHQKGEKFFVANTAKNVATIRHMVEKGKKYRNLQAHKVITPTPEFYKLYSKKQIFDIIWNIEVHKEIPRQYSYFDGGAVEWDKYARRLWHEDTANSITSTIALLHSNIGNIDRLIEGATRVNVIDVGPGNCLPVKELLTHLLYERGVLNRYIAVDISEKMLQIAKKNIHSWFDGAVQFESHIRDISHERFDDILLEETLREDANTTVNLVLFLGGTLTNFRSPDDVLKVIHNSMQLGDILIYTKKLDTEDARQYFDFSTSNVQQSLPLQNKFTIDMLNIDESLYDVEQGYDPEERARYFKIKPKMALTLKFEFETGHRFIEIKNGESLLILRARHQNATDIIDQFDSNGLELLEASTTQDRDYMLLITAITSRQ